MNQGHIYILQNPSFPNLLKIGKTNRSPKARALELSASTGVPTEFIVVFDVYVPDCDAGEKEVHDKLRKYRAASNREFFELSISEAKEVLIDSATKQINHEILILEQTFAEKISRYRYNLEKEISDKKKYFEKIKNLSSIPQNHTNIDHSHEKQKYNEELLIKAIKWGKERVIMSLLEKNVRIPLRNESGKYVKEIAAEFGNEHLYEKYVKLMNRRTKG